MALNRKLTIPAAPLERTREHHEAIGSSAGSRNPDEYRTSLAELMSDDELRAYMEKELGLVREEHAQLNKSHALQKKGFLMIRDKFLIPNLHYLTKIGRLPEGFDVETIEKELRIPEEIE